MSKWTRKYQGLYADGKEKISSLIEWTPPVPTIITEGFRSGGMDMEIDMDMGMEKLSASFTIGEDPDILSLFGIKQNAKQVPIFIRSHLENDVTGDKHTVIEELRCKVVSIDMGTISVGSSSSTTVTLSPMYYKYHIEETGLVVWEIDPINMVRIVNGVDQLADARASLGK